MDLTNNGWYTGNMFGYSMSCQNCGDNIQLFNMLYDFNVTNTSIANKSLVDFVNIIDEDLSYLLSDNSLNMLVNL